MKQIIVLFLILSLVSQSYQSCSASLLESALTETEKQQILDFHNLVRNQNANGDFGLPQAKNMYEMVWDNTAAQIAQNWANTCPSGHNSERGPYGENLYVSWNSAKSNFNAQVPVQIWFDEYKDLNQANIAQSYSVNDRGVTGHYTQVVWAKSYKLGCGKSLVMDGRMFKSTVICNYGPPGNFMGAPVYEQGPKGSGCQVKSAKYSNLCSSQGLKSEEQFYLEEQPIENANMQILVFSIVPATLYLALIMKFIQQ